MYASTRSSFFFWYVVTYASDSTSLSTSRLLRGAGVPAMSYSQQRPMMSGLASRHTPRGGTRNAPCAPAGPSGNARVSRAHHQGDSSDGGTSRKQPVASSTISCAH
eukprot:360082-Chlamydomonas_euryale.AAC.4